MRSLTGGLVASLDTDLTEPAGLTRARLALTASNEADRGGHFAAWEEPELFAAELRAAFRSLR